MGRQFTKFLVVWPGGDGWGNSVTDVWLYKLRQNKRRLINTNSGVEAKNKTDNQSGTIDGDKLIKQNILIIWKTRFYSLSTASRLRFILFYYAFFAISVKLTSYFNCRLEFCAFFLAVAIRKRIFNTTNKIKRLFP